MGAHQMPVAQLNGDSRPRVPGGRGNWLFDDS
jgi:hypothetical protein